MKKHIGGLGRGALGTPELAAVLEEPRFGEVNTGNLETILGGRSFGTVMDDQTRFEQPIPDFCVSIAGEMRASSVLLKLDPTSTYDAVLNAYATDVKFLQSRLSDLENLAKGAIRASLKYQGRAGDWQDDGRAESEKQWRVLQEGIPVFAKAPLIELSAERACLPVALLLPQLKEAVNAGIDNAMKRFVLWLDVMVGREYIGLVRFTSDTVGHYYYYRPYIAHEEQVKRLNQTSTFDASVPFGERTTYTDRQGVLKKVTESIERHDHHIVRAKVDTLANYDGRIPNPIVMFLDSTPSWLQQHLRVVSGEITMEVIRRRDVRRDVTYEERISTWKGSPTIALGSYALNGWSVDDLKTHEGSYAQAQKKKDVASAADRREARQFVAIVVGVIFAFAAFGTWAIWSSNKVVAAAYQEYMVAQGGKPVFTVAKETSATLPRGETLKFRQYKEQGRSLRLATDADVAKRKNLRPEMYLKVPHGAPEVGAYGSANLLDLGIPAMINVTKVAEGEISFTIDYSND